MSQTDVNDSLSIYVCHFSTGEKSVDNEFVTKSEFSQEVRKCGKNEETEKAEETINIATGMKDKSVFQNFTPEQSPSESAAVPVSNLEINPLSLKKPDLLPERYDNLAIPSTSDGIQHAKPSEDLESGESANESSSEESSDSSQESSTPNTASPTTCGFFEAISESSASSPEKSKESVRRVLPEYSSRIRALTNVDSYFKSSANTGTNTWDNTRANTGTTKSANTGADTYANSGLDIETDTVGNTGYNSAGHTTYDIDVNTDANTDANIDTNTFANIDTNTYANIDTNTYANIDTNTYANIDTNTYANIDTNTYANIDTNTYANTCTNTGYSTGINTDVHETTDFNETTDYSFGTTPCRSMTCRSTSSICSVESATKALITTAKALSDAANVLSNTADKTQRGFVHPTTTVTTLAFVATALSDVTSALSKLVSSVPIEFDNNKVTVLTTAALAAETRAVTMARAACNFHMSSIPPSNEKSNEKVIIQKEYSENQEMCGKPPKLPEVVASSYAILTENGYSLQYTLGTGSFSTVKVADSEKHKCKVAIRIVSKSRVPQYYIEKFLPRVLKVVRVLRHPNVVQFMQVIETTHRVYFVMEYAEHGSLLDRIRRDSYIVESAAKKWFRQIAEAVNYLHEQGIVHRDIKCDNLLLDCYDDIKMSEFIFSRPNMYPANGVDILSETYCGTPAYAAPEILRGTPYKPQLSDVWSMGIVLHAMVFGRLPFHEDNIKIMLKKMEGKLTLPKVPRVSTSCKTLICRMLTSERRRINIASVLCDRWFSSSMRHKSHHGHHSTDSHSLNRVSYVTTHKKISNMLSPLKRLLRIKSHEVSIREETTSETEQYSSAAEESCTTKRNLSLPLLGNSCMPFGQRLSLPSSKNWKTLASGTQ